MPRRSVASPTPTINARGNWVSGTSYSVNDGVVWNDVPYQCIVATSGTTNPFADTTHWNQLPYWVFANCTFNGSWDLTNFSYPMWCDFYTSRFNISPTATGTAYTDNAGVAISPGNPFNRLRTFGCRMTITTTTNTTPVAINSGSTGNDIQIYDTHIFLNDESGGIATMNALKATAGKISVGGGCSFDTAKVTQTGTGVIAPVAAGVRVPVTQNPKDSTPANRPTGVLGSEVIYSGGFYICTNETTPTWAQISAS